MVDRVRAPTGRSWDPEQPGRRAGRAYAVTGATSGIGYFIAEQLAATGARVVLVGRSAERLAAAASSIDSRVAGAALEPVVADLADISSVRRAAEAIVALGPLDGLVENAAVITPGRRRATTVDGHELAFGTNHLGHFVLAAGVLPALLDAPGSRVVTTGSVVTHVLPYAPDDLESERRYGQWRAYANSKHATELFGFELDRRLAAARSQTRALVVHPGGALDGRTPRRAGVSEPGAATCALHALAFAFAQGKDRGAWPAVRALLDPSLRGGDYIGPSRLGTGRPVLARPSRTSRDTRLGAELWARSELLTGTVFDVAAAAT